MIRKIEESRPFNEVETYLMTINPNIISAKDLDDGTSIPVAGYLLYEDVKDDGHSEEIMAVITPDRKVYAFQSATFKKSIKDIFDVMNGKPFSVIKTSGLTKAGRSYINCYLDIDSVDA